MKLYLTAQEAKTVILLLQKELDCAQPMDSYGDRHVKRVARIAVRLNKLAGKPFVLVNIPKP